MAFRPNKVIKFAAIKFMRNIHFSLSQPSGQDGRVHCTARCAIRVEIVANTASVKGDMGGIC